MRRAIPLWALAVLGVTLVFGLGACGGGSSDKPAKAAPGKVVLPDLVGSKWGAATDKLTSMDLQYISNSKAANSKADAQATKPLTEDQLEVCEMTPKEGEQVALYSVVTLVIAPLGKC